MSSQRGSLTIAGAGVATIGHLTLQTVSAIETADIVCYLLNDPATEAFIRKKNPNVYDLYQLYDDGKPRLETYIQMVEVLLSKVRQGQDVVGLFYGHPGYMAVPSRRALKIALQEGYSAKMLPGISTDTALVAELDIDPVLSGCQVYDASELLDPKNVLNANNNVLVCQVGYVGNRDFNFLQMENPQLDKLVDRLEDVYGKHRDITHYTPAMLPIDDPVIEKLKISDLRRPEIQKKINAASCFYIPLAEEPRDVLDSDEAKKLQRSAISALANHQPGKNYPQLKERPALNEALERLALDQSALNAYKRNRQAWVNENGRGLDDEERKALATGQGIRQLLVDRPISENRVAPVTLSL